MFFAISKCTKILHNITSIKIKTGNIVKHIVSNRNSTKILDWKYNYYLDTRNMALANYCN